jgi:hypothetical protein
MIWTPIVIIGNIYLLTVSAILIFAGSAKIIDDHEFALGLARVNVIPELFRTCIVIWTPWLEIVTGIALAHMQIRKGGRLLALMLGVSIIIYAATAWFLGRSAECSCFGHIQVTTAWWQNVILGMFISVAFIVPGYEVHNNRYYQTKTL